ncbi:hypothetical protein KI387_015717, partial [Taxus chinensis]
LYFWQPNVGATLTTQIFNLLCKCIEDANGIKECRLKANIVQYRPILKEENQRVDCVREFLGISFEEQPDKHFFVIRSHHLVMESDSSLPSIFDKLQSYRKAITLNFEGFQYKFADFQLKVFKVSQSESLKAVVMEVEYLPVSSLEKTRALMDEFFELWQELLSSKALSGQIFNIDPNFAEYRLSDHYSWQHTAVLYSSAMAQAMSTRN